MIELLLLVFHPPLAMLKDVREQWVRGWNFPGNLVLTRRDLGLLKIIAHEHCTNTKVHAAVLQPCVMNIDCQASLQVIAFVVHASMSTMFSALRTRRCSSSRINRLPLFKDTTSSISLPNGRFREWT